MPEKVLLATDGSKDAVLAARAAVDACEGGGAELHVVHVWFSIPTAHLRPFMRNELKRLGNELLEEGVKGVEDSGGLVTEAHLIEGRAADEILDLAERIGADLVVIGSRGLGPVGRIALGSVSEAVIHHSRCPVLVLRGGGDVWPPERVVFGEDGSEAARAACDLGVSLCGRRGARALLLHAYPRLPELDAEDREFDPRIVDDDLRKAENVLLGRSRELEGRLGSRPKTRLVAGDAACLLEAAEEDAPERTVLAVGSRGLGAIGRMRLGSVSTKVVRAAKSPVLIHPYEARPKRGGERMDPFPMTVLLATEGSEEAELASRMAAALAKRTGSELHIVCVVDLGVGADPRLQEGLRQRARELLDDRAQKISESGGAVADTHVCIGRPDREIIALAEKISAGVIVLGSRGLGGMKRALMGSVSDSVVRHAHCPVMVVREAQAEV